MAFPRRAVVVLGIAAACGGSRGATTPPLRASGPPLPPPPPSDAHARGASYLDTVAGHIQPQWGQFLEDCRLRLPGSHPLNQAGLVAVAELAIARTGKVDARIVTSSGNGDFDTAVFDVLGDVVPLPTPPRELASDDELVHLRWLFARDSRQAGAATAQVLDVRLPLLGVVDRMIAAGALPRAAQRIAVAPKSEPDRLVATEHLMIATLRAGLRSSNGAVRRAAADAIGRANLQSLAPDVHALVMPVADADLRIVAIEVAARLRDPAVVPSLIVDLQDDLQNRPRVALAKLDALVALGRGAAAKDAIRVQFAGPAKLRPAPHVLAALARVPDPELAPMFPTWFAASDPTLRAAVCDALPAANPDVARRLVTKGLHDPDAGVRAACTEASVRAAAPKKLDVQILRRLHELARDRDRSVRAHAIAALGVVEPNHKLRLIADPAAEVRLASVSGASEAELRLLVNDREPEIRAAALTALGDRAADLIARATADLAAPVRRAAVGVVLADDVLEKLAADDSPEVATAALVRLAERRGRAAMTSPLVGGLAVVPGGAERVRIALAWLLAR